MKGIGCPGRPGVAHIGASGRAARRLVLAIVLASVPLVPAAAADNTASALEAAGWSESSPGLLTSLPQRTVAVRDSGIGGEFALAPGSALVWERRFRDASGSGTAMEIEMSSEGPNASSQDYRENRASFPVSVTVVFGRDSLDRPLRTKILDFIAALWRGFRPAGVRLTYATGNVAPVGSMYRLADEETVFILGGNDDKGKTITVRRNVAEDFRAAYGRDPRGPVTRLLVRAERPSRETGTIKARIGVAFAWK